MIPDPIAARRYIAPDPAHQVHRRARRCTIRPNARLSTRSGYAWVKKRVERTETVVATSERVTIVYSLGTLYGAWPDGASFEGNRYVDRYVVRDGLIVRMEVWNDSAEWLLTRAGLACDDPARQGAA